MNPKRISPGNFVSCILIGAMVPPNSCMQIRDIMTMALSTMQKNVLAGLNTSVTRENIAPIFILGSCVAFPDII